MPRTALPTRLSAGSCLAAAGSAVLTVLTVLMVLAVAGPAGAVGAAGPGPRWRWPVEPPVRVVRAFDPPAGPYAAGHRGVDLAAPTGAAVRSAGPGTVVVAGLVAGRPVVVVAHGDVRSTDELRTTYQPVEPSVGVGQRVDAGDELGAVGTWAGHCPEPGCLHWGLRRGTTYLDPTSLLAGPVRLLPVGAPVPVDRGAPPAGPERTPAPSSPTSPAPYPTSPTSAAGSPGGGGSHGSAVRAGVVGVALGVPAAVAAAVATRRRGRRPARRGSSP